MPVRLAVIGIGRAATEIRIAFVRIVFDHVHVVRHAAERGEHIGGRGDQLRIACVLLFVIFAAAGRVNFRDIATARGYLPGVAADVR